jgi:hypothetical protein
MKKTIVYYNCVWKNLWVEKQQVAGSWVDKRVFIVDTDFGLFASVLTCCEREQTYNAVFFLASVC